MMYILDQRLRAQNIPDEKAKKGELKCSLASCAGNGGAAINFLTLAETMDIGGQSAVNRDFTVCIIRCVYRA